MMDATTRRIVATAAHARRTGHTPRRIDSLGTGESFQMEPTSDGFIDVASGTRIASATIDLTFDDDVNFSGQIGGERFSGRSGGGATVTVYDGGNYVQYAVAD